MSNADDKRYSNGEVTVVWRSERCIHSANCVSGLPAVFDPNRRPWIDVKAASTPAIVAQVNKCPSGALSWESARQAAADEPAEATRIEATVNGPLLVYGEIAVKDAAGNVERRSKTTAFCRCGGSSKKPYCDGTHQKIGFRG